MNELIPDPPNAYRHKLTFGDRCAIFTFYHLHNISQVRLARAFNVDKKTVSAICDTNGKRYKNVHEELIKKTIVGMSDAWTTLEHIAMVNDAKVMEKRPPPPKLAAPSKMHNKGAYEIHKCKDGSFHVAWVDAWAADLDGWYAVFNAPERGYYGKNADDKPFLTAMDGVRYWKQQLGE